MLAPSFSSFTSRGVSEASEPASTGFDSLPSVLAGSSDVCDSVVSGLVEDNLHRSLDRVSGINVVQTTDGADESLRVYA